MMILIAGHCRWGTNDDPVLIKKNLYKPEAEYARLTALYEPQVTAGFPFLYQVVAFGIE